MSNQKNVTSVYLGKSQNEWLKKQPRSFSFSKLIRQLLDDYLNSLAQEDDDHELSNNI